MSAAGKRRTEYDLTRAVIGGLPLRSRRSLLEGKLR